MMLLFWQVRPEPVWTSVTRIFFLAIVFLAIGLELSTNPAFAQTPTAEIRSLDGGEVVGTMLDVTVDQLKVETGAGVKTLDLGQIETIKFPESAKVRQPEQAAKFQLLDGSSVFVDKYKYAEGRIEAALSTGKVVSISKRNVSSIVFAGDRETIQKQVRQINQDASIAADTLGVIRGGEFNAIEGIVKRLDQDSVQFAIDDQSRAVPISKLAAITFFKASKTEYSAPLATCVLSDSSRVKLRSFKLGAKQLTLTSLTGDLFQVEFSKVVSIEFNSTETIQLSEVPPSTNDWRPLLADSGIVGKLKQLRLARFDRAFDGQSLSLEFPRPTAEVEAGRSRSAIREFDSGIAIQGGGRLAWRLDGNFISLSGLLGFSPQASEFGSVRVRMLADGDVVFDQELSKKAMTEPKSFEIDLTGRRRMIIEIDYADGRSIGDVIHLVNLALKK